MASKTHQEFYQIPNMLQRSTSQCKTSWDAATANVRQPCCLTSLLPQKSSTLNRTWRLSGSSRDISPTYLQQQEVQQRASSHIQHVESTSTSA
jgi:hypothetical protein